MYAVGTRSITSFIIICPRSVFPAFFPISSTVDRITCEGIAELAPLCPLRFLHLLRPIFRTYFLAILTFCGSSLLYTLEYFAKSVLLFGSITFFGNASLLKRILFLGVSYPSTSSPYLHVLPPKNFFPTPCNSQEPIDSATDINIGFARDANKGRKPPVCLFFCPNAKHLF